MSLEAPWRLPAGWRWTPLGELFDTASGEWGAEPGEAALDVPVVRSTETRGETADVAAAELRSLTRRQFEKTALREDDILVVKSSGSAHLVGRASLVTGLGDTRAGFSNFMLRLRAKTGTDPRLVFAFLTSPAGRALFVRLNRTTSGLRNLIEDRYLRVPIPVADPEVQQRLGERLGEVDAALEAAAATERALRELRTSALLEALDAPQLA